MSVWRKSKKESMKYGALAVALGMTLSCMGSQGPAEVEVSVQEVRAGQGNGNSFVSMDILVTEGKQAVSCDEGQLDVKVSTATSADGPFTEIPGSSYEVRCTSDESGDMALVVDNSGSEQGYLASLQEAAGVMVDAVLDAGGRASVVRVSTESQVWQEPTDDRALLQQRIDELYIRNGWTALYDGIRMGNETLGGVSGQGASHEGLDDFCTADRKLGVVVFTDGRENNSSNQSLQSDEYPGDGLDTTLDDLYQLKVNNVTTPIYTVGLGDEVDHSGLEDLASYTGGRHHRVDDESDLPSVFQVISDYLSSSVKVCTEVPVDVCGDIYVKTEYSWSPCEPGDETCAAEPIAGSQTQKIHLDCPVAQQGKAATLLLTMSNPGIDRDVARTLAANAVDWVTPAGESPRVLLVKDENHHGEFSNDPEYVRDLLTEAGVDVTLLDEPAGGLSIADTTTFNVVWVSNPGYPLDDRATLHALAEFSEGGGGYVLQGDDLTWLWGDRGYSMSPFTGVVHENNGTRFCGKRIDNNATDYRYHVQFNSESHPVVAGLEGGEFLYGDDIDNSYPAGDGEEVLAWADGADKSGAPLCDAQVPVVIVRSP